MQSTEFLLHQRSGVVTAKSAKQWLKELPMADARSAHHAGSALLREVANAALAPFDRLEILETLRSHLAEIDLLYSRRYAGKSLPLGLAERNAFTHAQRQWRALACAYLEIFELAADGTANLAARRALCLARAGGYFCDALKGHLRAGQAGAEEIVEDLQRLHELATEHGLVDTKVRDSLHPRGVTSIALIYSRALLIGQGATINGGLEREAMFALAQSWEGKIVCKALPIDARGEARSEQLPPAPGERRQRLRQTRFGQRMHLLDVTLLSRSLRKRMRKLGAGDPLLPDSLPEQFRQLPIREVLGRLHAIWCEQGDVRLEQRSAAGGAPLAGRPQVVSLSHAGDDYQAMHFMVAGRLLELNDDDAGSRRRHDELFVFQHASLSRQEARLREASRLFEDWIIADESATGFGLRRMRAGARFRIGQLIAMRLRLDGSDGPVVLAQVRWLREPETASGEHAPGALQAGVEILKGKPHAVGLRPAGPDAVVGAVHCAAFRLGSLHAKESVMVIAPCGWYKPDRLLEMNDAGLVYRLRASALLQRGCDFEQFEAVIVA